MPPAAVSQHRSWGCGASVAVAGAGARAGAGKQALPPEPQQALHRRVDDASLLRGISKEILGKPAIPANRAVFEAQTKTLDRRHTHA